MMNKHTPGPWYPPHFTDVDTTCDCGHVFSEHQQHMGSVCTVRWDKDDLGFDAQRKSEAIANAHLIASAPDMYEALHEARLQIKYLHEKFQETGTGNAVLAKIDAALSKAEGAP